MQAGDYVTLFRKLINENLRFKGGNPSRANRASYIEDIKDKELSEKLGGTGQFEVWTNGCGQLSQKRICSIMPHKYPLFPSCPVIVVCSTIPAFCGASKIRAESNYAEKKLGISSDKFILFASNMMWL